MSVMLVVSDIILFPTPPGDPFSESGTSKCFENNKTIINFLSIHIAESPANQ